jgi:hypothetical protein
MRRVMIAAILAWSGALAGAAMAQASGPPTVDWTVQDLLDNPAAKAVLDRDLPGAEDDPRLALVRSMTLRTVSQFPEAGIDAAKLAKIAADLAAIGRR